VRLVNLIGSKSLPEAPYPASFDVLLRAVGLPAGVLEPSSNISSRSEGTYTLRVDIDGQQPFHQLGLNATELATGITVEVVGS
jgi:hypothetical protein